VLLQEPAKGALEDLHHPFSSPGTGLPLV